ncbi:MAG: hypothetical protein ACRC62_12095, partial [Microcoleus sp.]
IAATVEEFLEMLGIVVFIHALISYINKCLGGLSWKVNFGKTPNFSQTESIEMEDLRKSVNRKSRS